MRRISPVVCALIALVFGPAICHAQGADVASAKSAAVLVTPDNVSVSSSEAVQFTALVRNTSHVAVTWSASQGTISGSGLYRGLGVRPDTVVTVTATSKADGTKIGTASIVIKPAESPTAHVQTASSSGTSKAIQLSFFGADFHGASPWPPTDGLNQTATLGGIRLWDDDVKWAQIETAAGVYDWAELDVWISKAQGQNMDVLYTIGNTPQWAGSIPAGSPCGSQGAYSCSPPTDVNSDGTGTDKHFSDFITALVQRYKGEIAFYELWNEPDCTCFFSGTQAQLVRMGKDAAAIIRANDPNAKILSPSAHGPTMATWFDAYVAAGGAANFDIVNAHLRGGISPPNSDPEAFLTMYADVTTETAKVGLTSLPIWDDEHGIKQNQLTDPDELAGYVARSAILRAGVGIQRQYVYTWNGGSIEDLQGNLSGTAWDVVAGWLIGHTISPCVESGTVYTCAVDNGQIVWDTAQSCSNGVCTTSSYTYPSRFRKQTDLTGTKTSLSGKTVNIGYKPILLTSDWAKASSN